MFLFSRMTVAILTISCLLTYCVGCGTDEEPEVAQGDEKQELLPDEKLKDGSEVIEQEPPPVILYPGAPVITIEETAFSGWEGINDPPLHYRLIAEDPLPYDIQVLLSLRSTYTVDGWLYGDVDEFDGQKANKLTEMRKDRLTYEDSVVAGSDKRIQTRTLQILPWIGPGDAPYNVGKPSRLKIIRKPVEGKVVPKIVSVEPPSDSEIVVDGDVTITFDGETPDVKVSYTSSLLLVDGWLAGQRIKSPLFKINGNVLTLTQLTPGYTTDFTIRWGGDRTRKTLRYIVPMEVSIDRVVLGGSLDGKIHLWDVDTGTHVAFINERGPVMCVALSPDKRTIACGVDKTVRLWDADTGTLKNTLRGHTEDVLSVAFSPDGRTIVSGSWRETLHLWDADTGAPKDTLKEDVTKVLSVAFSPDGRTIAISDNFRIYLWDVDAGTVKNTFGEHARYAWCLAFSPDGRTLVAGNGRTIRLWDADTGALKNTLSAHTETVRSVAFSPDGRTIASGSSDETLRLWDADTGAHKKRLGWHRNWARNVAFSPDGRTIVSTDSDDLYLWDADTGALKYKLYGQSNDIISAAFSPD